jgi:hypothetical protein
MYLAIVSVKLASQLEQECCLVVHGVEQDVIEVTIHQAIAK